MSPSAPRQHATNPAVADDKGRHALSMVLVAIDLSLGHGSNLAISGPGRPALPSGEGAFEGMVLFASDFQLWG